MIGQPSIGVTQPSDAELERILSPARLSTYATAASDRTSALQLYVWNTAVAADLSVTLGHVEIVLRNAMHDALTARHDRYRADQRRRGLPDPGGSWLDDPQRILDTKARDDIAKAKRRLSSVPPPIPAGKIVAELTFGFWRFLLASRYTTTLWPALRHGFPHLGSRDRTRLEDPVARLHGLRNRIAHLEPLIAVPLQDRVADMATVLGAIHPDLPTWATAHSRLPHLLATRPT